MRHGKAERMIIMYSTVIGHKIWREYRYPLLVFTRFLITPTPWLSLKAICLLSVVSFPMVV